MRTKIFLLLLLFSFIAPLKSQFSRQIITTDENNIQLLKWDLPRNIQVADKTIHVLSFEGCKYPRSFDGLPYLLLQKEEVGNEHLQADLVIIETAILTAEEKLCIPEDVKINEHFATEIIYNKARNIPYTMLKIFPVRLNPSTGNYEKLISYRVNWTSTSSVNKQNQPDHVASFANSSVLANGTWYKIAISGNGVYKIDKDFLTKLGIDGASIKSSDIRVFGNGGKILPEKNSAFRYDDLQELAIKVVDGNDNSFDKGDYLLFYGRGAHQWDYLKNAPAPRFTYTKNYYSDSAYYFITVDNGPGKRIQNQASLSQHTYVSSSFDDYAIHEIDAVNNVKSGREKYGEFMDIVSSYTFSFNFPSLVIGDTTTVKTSIAGRNTSNNANFQVTYPNGNYIVSCPPTGNNYTDDIAKESSGLASYENTSSGVISVAINKLNGVGSPTSGWINYVLLNTRRYLAMNGTQMAFRDSRNIGPGQKSLFQLSSATNATTIWDVTDLHAVANQQYNFNAGTIEFTVNTDTLKEFVAFSNGGFLQPTAVGKIENQNLHAQQAVDYIIITHPLFKPQAEKLARFHQKVEGYSYVVATIDEIYNEFSSGAQDITAIRDFTRMLYQRGSAPGSVLPKYLLLFGDGSHDNFHRYSVSNTNFVPTYQSYSSISIMGSITSDDFFGFMDDAEGDFNNSDIVDVGVGRIPANNTNVADGIINKIFAYYQKDSTFQLNNNLNSCLGTNSSTMGDWKNWICFVADDVDNAWEKTFVVGSENYANVLISKDSSFNIDKIYCDAYKQEATPGGQRYPEANEAVNNRMEKGALILNYSGHGGEVGLAHEAVVDVGQILNWKNIHNMPMFLTATCEFSRYDDPLRTSAGEYVLTNPNGGGIGLLTTTRIAFASDADVLCPDFFISALTPLSNGKMPAIGDVIRQTKTKAGPAYRHFTLLGDPALTLAYPTYRVQTTEINQHPVNTGFQDTISALEKVTVKGFVTDKNGNKLTTYNGVVYPTVFDKAVKYTTLGNDLGPSTQMSFNLQKNTLYKGKATIVNGDFQFSFIVPKDISYRYDLGRISYYFQNGLTDGSGFFTNFIIGGSDSTAKPDNHGPEIKLFMNDNKFVFGGLTNENPKVYAELFDSSGINTVGNGIGHDLVAILDGNNSKPVILNDYYQADLDNFNSGKVLYPFSALPEGRHTLSLKVWDVQNNSSFTTTEFVVSSSSELALKHVLNYPNPFTTSTKFFVEHNQCCSYLNLEIQIFTISGKIIKTITKPNLNQGFRTEGIEWDGKDDFGDKIGKGVYVYRVLLKDQLGKKAEKYEKLVILN